MSPDEAYYNTDILEQELKEVKKVLSALVVEMMTRTVPECEVPAHRNRMSYWEGKNDALEKVLKFVRSKQYEAK